MLAQKSSPQYSETETLNSKNAATMSLLNLKHNLTNLIG
jgi:hypothetical protein